MAVTEKLRGLILSANELTEMTDWPDRLIEDYLTIDENFVVVADASDTDNAQIAINTANISTNTANISTNTSNISTNTSNISTNSVFISANKQSYTATYSSNVYTVTPEINPTVFATWQAGLILNVRLPVSATVTGDLSANYDGTSYPICWADPSETRVTTGELEAPDNTYVTLRVNAAEDKAIVISDVSGSNANGEWVRFVSGAATAFGSIASFALGSNVIAGSASITLPITMLNTGYDVTATGRPDTDSDFYGFVYVNSGKSTTSFTPIFRNGATSQNVIDGTWSVDGRWY